MLRIATIDLFGERIVEEISESKSLRKPTRPNGYAAIPGTGPQGETCRSCEHARGTGYHGRNYYKCELMRAHWTRGPGSDIRLKSPACRHWQRETRQEQQ